jgi:polar amino acid transport system permease protein|tara:strand:+ start:531 stop:1367 length:837 start_codon:yes stop_codon:yes gene_type:complete
MSYKTDLPVMLQANPHAPEPFLGLKLWHILPIGLIAIFGPGLAFAQSTNEAQSPLSVLLDWAPLLLKGFAFNLIISFCAMALGTIIGGILGLGQISLLAVTRHSSWLVTQFFRNAPWLVLLFFAMFLLPFEMNVFGFKVPFPDWLKAILGLSLPVMANVSEIVRGAVRSLPSGQWEAAESLAYTRLQTLWLIILPQCIKRMLPPWMNLYSILTMATVLASIVGVNEVMTLTGQALASEGGRPELLAPFYGFILLLFFIYCYPIARFTVWLEKKYAFIT